MASRSLDSVPRLVWRPVLDVAQLVRRVQEAAERVRRQVREIAALVWRTLEGAALQTTRMRTRSQLEWVVGSLTVTIASDVVYAREGQ